MYTAKAELLELLEIYANAVGRYGPQSDKALSVRQKHKSNEEFLAMADSLDRIKRALGGSGIDEPALACSEAAAPHMSI